MNDSPSPPAAPSGLPAAPSRPPEAGAQAERTRLAWRRTVLAMTVVALLVTRMAIHTGVTSYRAAGIVATVGMWLLGLSVAQRRIAVMARPEPAAMARTVLLIGLSTLGTAAIGAVLCVADLY
jgi:uncharacterized membrane protein YidH (DUF202 family)